MTPLTLWSQEKKITSCTQPRTFLVGVIARKNRPMRRDLCSQRLGDIMKVAKDLVVSLAYQVRTEDGVLVDESPVSAPLDYLHGHGSLISGLENALENHVAGDKFEVHIPANDAYGQYDDNLVQRVPKDVFMGVDELQVGMRFLAETDQGPVPVEITEVEDEHVVVDGNHMLAGQNLNFNVEVVAIREATPEELAHGHVHGADGHHHDHDHDHDHGHDHGQGGCGTGGCGCSH
ncbi:SlyD [Pantoea ananatis LMG 20103]|uniref:Peptidyl-prolyl cis-trans isomerase n=3 Tax=Pantoea ananas TaxID=553 RepID=D4GCJ4_PANAM|nr:SlyD [Pantoea ananatis LMG 20103]PKC33664.1 peptidyl-prolyl cis-trans isomerase [Pantoea ananatis 15320]PKC45957.1 peptidyl-prolyl cis-trans isomerase [Pantoea ananatis BRT98]